VLTVDPADPSFPYPMDSSFPAAPGVEVIRTKLSPTMLDRYARWKKNRPVKAPASQGGAADQNPADASAGRGFLRTQLVAGMTCPDRQINWYSPAVQTASRILEKAGIAAVVSSAPPFTAHLVARQLKRKYKVPVILDFRDAWTCDSWRRLEAIPRWRDWLERRMERSCLQAADAVICVTDEARDDLLRVHPGVPAKKFLTIPNGFDAGEAPPGAGASSDGRQLFVHLGTLYGDRRVDGFCRAIGQLVRDGALNPAQFKVLFVGDADPGFIEGAHREAPGLLQSGTIEFCPRVDWDKGQRLLSQATALVLIQGHIKEAIPAKAFEYVCAGKPIFAIVSEGALSRMLDETGLGCWASPDDTAQIAAQFLKTVRALPRSADEIRHAARKYEFCHLTSQLAAVIRAYARVPAAE